MATDIEHQAVLEVSESGLVRKMKFNVNKYNPTRGGKLIQVYLNGFQRKNVLTLKMTMNNVSNIPCGVVVHTKCMRKTIPYT